MLKKNLASHILIALCVSTTFLSTAPSVLAARRCGPGSGGDSHPPMQRPLSSNSSPGSMMRGPNSPNPGTRITPPRGTVSRPQGPGGARPPQTSGTAPRRPEGPNISRPGIRPNNGSPMRPGPQISRPGGPNRPGINRPPMGPGPVRRPMGVHRPPIGHPYPHWRRSNIVFRYGWPRNYYWWGCRRGISFGDYLILALILESVRQSRHDATMDTIYTEHINGLSYPELCDRYGIDWYSIDSRARLRYSQMHSYAVSSGISFWAWGDRIYY